MRILKAALHSQRFERAGGETKWEQAPLIKSSDQSDRKRPSFGRFGRRDKFNSHQGRLRSLPKESILVPVQLPGALKTLDMEISLNRFCVVQENTKPEVLKNRPSLRDQCIKTEGFIFSCTMRGQFEFCYLIGSNFDSYHLVEHILLLSSCLSLL